MPGRKLSSSILYRYGFNGKEEDDEVKGDGNQIAYESRIYDTRLGRWLSIDPLTKKYPSESPYLYTGGNPVVFGDVDGKDRILFINIINQQTGENTFIKVKLSNEVRSELNRVYYSHDAWYRGSGYYDEYKWHDIDMTINITIDKSGHFSSITAKEEKGKYRTATSIRNETWAKLFIPQKGKDKKGGLVLTSKDASHNWNNTNEPNAKYIDGFVNIDKIIASFNVASNANSMAKKPESFVEVLEYLKGAKEGGETLGEAVEAVKEALEKEPDDNTTYCETCNGNYKKDKEGNITKDTSSRAAKDTTRSHNDKPRIKKTKLN